MAAESGDNFLRGALQQIEALTDIVELAILDEQVMHAAHRRSDESDTVVASVSGRAIEFGRRQKLKSRKKDSVIVRLAAGIIDCFPTGAQGAPDRAD